MVLRRVVTDELCKDGYNCHGIWVDDDLNMEDVVIVGEDLGSSPVPLGAGERAIRIRRQIVQSANL